MTIFEDNRALLQAFRKGNPDAVSEVFRAYVEDVATFLQRGFVFSSSGRSCRFEGYKEHFELQDAVQETFIRAFSERARLQYDGVRNYRSYLFAIARNFVIDEFRKVESKMRWYRFEDVEPQPGDSAGGRATMPDSEKMLESDELAELIRGFEASLSPSERAVFEARFTRGESQRNAAETLGVTRMKLRIMEYRIRSKALKFFKKTGYLPPDLRFDESTMIFLLSCVIGWGR